MNTKHSAILSSFGRRRGRKLHKNRSALYETLLPELLIDLENLRGYAEEPKVTTPLEGVSVSEGGELCSPPYKKKSLWLELGFGGGEHLAEQAKRNPNVNFIGCEPYINGVASLLAEIQKHHLNNIRLYDDDARFALEKLPDHCLEKIFILFPDPWPKTRHHKKRIISQNSLQLFYRKLKPGGLLRIATDHVDYGAWILENMLAFGKFEWQAHSQADWSAPPLDWVRTRYQEKAEAESRKAVFLNWVAK